MSTCTPLHNGYTNVGSSPKIFSLKDWRVSEIQSSYKSYGKAVQVEIRRTKHLAFNQLKVHPFQISGFRCQPAPLHRGDMFKCDAIAVGRCRLNTSGRPWG